VSFAASPLRHLGVVLATALLLSGCRLDLAAVADVAADGSASVGLEVAFDPVLLDELDALGVDPTAELEVAVAATEGWTTSRTTADDGGLVVTVSREVAAAEDVGDAFRELAAGLSVDDPALLVDLEVAVDGEGGATVEGSGSFRAPATAGARLDGVPVGPSGEELATIVASSVVPTVRLTLPGPIDAHDGDVVDGRTITWELASDPRPVTAVATPPAWWEGLGLPVVLVGGLVVLLVVLLAVGLLVRRGRA
jgi:hypothetical protein